MPSYYWSTARTGLANRLFLLLVLVSLSLTAHGSPQDEYIDVKLTPSPTVTVAFNSTVTFECSVNDSSYHLHWSITYNHPPQDEFDIYFSNDHTLLTIETNMEELNESMVSCGVLNEVDGEVTNTVSCILLIQDHLSPVQDLYCNKHRFCSWTAPYNLEGVYIKQYIVTVTSNNESTVIRNFTTSDQSWVYCPHDADELIVDYGAVMDVTVVPVNTIGLYGEPVTTILKGIGSDSITLNVSILYKVSPNTIAINLEFSDGWLITNCVLSMSARLSNEQTKASHNSTQISLLSTNTLIYSEFTNYDKGHWNVTLELHLKNFVLMFTKEGISTFELQDLLITNPLYGSLCFQCLFIANTTAKGCLVKFEHNETKTMNELALLRARNESFAFACVSKIIKGGIYHIWAYDVNINESIPSAIPAITAREVQVNGPTPTQMTITATLSTSSHSIISTSTPNPTNPNDDGNKLFNDQLLLYIIVPIVVIMTALIVISIPVSIILWRCRSRKKKILKIVGNQVPELMSRIHSMDRNCTSNNKNSNKSNNMNKELRDHNNNNNNNTDSGGNDNDTNKPNNTPHISSETCNDNDNSDVIGNIQIERPSHVTRCHVIEKNCAISSIQPCEGTTLETLV